ncbi:hypothetical protein ScPMuIL_003775 [Solemya velum]
MTQARMCLLFFVLFITLASMALTLTGIVTDFWYTVDGSESSISAVQTNFSYHFGMWRRCFTKGIPMGYDTKDIYGDCVYTYRELAPLLEQDMNFEDARYLHLERSWVGCAIASAGVQLFTLLVVICGLWPGDCKRIKARSVHLAASIMTLLAGMCGIASGICFIALRDIDETTDKIYPTGVTQKYDYSFIVAWVGCGLCIVEGFIYLCLLKSDKDDDSESKYSYYSM